MYKYKVRFLGCKGYLLWNYNNNNKKKKKIHLNTLNKLRKRDGNKMCKDSVGIHEFAFHVKEKWSSVVGKGYKKLVLSSFPSDYSHWGP